MILFARSLWQHMTFRQDCLVDNSISRSVPVLDAKDDLTSKTRTSESPAAVALLLGVSEQIRRFIDTRTFEMSEAASVR